MIPQVDNPTAVLAFLAYLAVVLGIGAWAARAASGGMADYFIAGRRLNRFVVALSAVVSGRSVWLLLGFSGVAWARGVSAVWAVVGYVVVELLLFLYYARRLRRLAGTRDIITIPDFFAARFDDRDGRLRALLALVILVFMVAYVSAQLVAGGKALSTGFGMAELHGVLATALVVLIYTTVGGFVAVSLTDAFQALLMIVALVVLPAVVVSAAGGLPLVISTLAALDPSLVDPLSLGFGGLVGFLGIGLGSPGNPHIVARYLSIDDPEQLRVAAVVGTFWNVLMAWGALFLGLGGRVLLPEAAMLPGGDAENLYPLLAQQHLPPLLFGVVIAAVFAAIMSSADSQLLVAASCVVRDLYEKVLRRGAPLPPRRAVALSRAVVVAMVLAALAVGLLAEDVVFWLVLFAWAGLGAALGPTSILALYWRRTTRAGVAAGVVVGAVTTIVWWSVPVLRGAIYELIPAFVLAGLATVVVSLLTRPPPDVDRAFEEMR